MEEEKIEKVELIDFKKEAFRRKVMGVGEKAKAKAMGAVQWISNHPAEAAGIVTGLSVITGKIVKTHTIHEEQRRRDTQFFEHRSGKWCEAKRKLTPREQLEAESRHRNGETWTEILSDMRLLR